MTTRTRTLSCPSSDSGSCVATDLGSQLTGTRFVGASAAPPFINVLAHGMIAFFAFKAVAVSHLQAYLEVRGLLTRQKKKKKKFGIFLPARAALFS